MNRIEDIEKKHLETILAGKKITEFFPFSQVSTKAEIAQFEVCTFLGIVVKYHEDILWFEITMA